MVLSGLLTNLAAKSGRPQVVHSKKNEAETYIRTLLIGQALVMIRSWRKWASYQLLCYSSTCLSEAMS